jgi:aspartyl-tRNA(Asn)/glutamyl-tRNA(Gln) amidotransferase subunit C
MDVKKVATLAHLEISEEEVALYTPQMAGIVKYVEQLNELDTADIEPMLGGLTDEGEVTVTNRDDVVVPSFTQTEALSEAPSAVEGHFQVPKVL